MSASRYKAIGVIAVIFVLGGVTGGAVTRWMIARKLSELLESDPATVRQRAILFALDRKLDLSDGQRSRIGRILLSTWPEFAAVTRTCEVELRPVRKRTAARIREVLGREQQQRFDRLVKTVEAKLRRFESGSDHGSK